MQIVNNKLFIDSFKYLTDCINDVIKLSAVVLSQTSYYSYLHLLKKRPNGEIIILYTTCHTPMCLLFTEICLDYSFEILGMYLTGLLFIQNTSHFRLPTIWSWSSFRLQHQWVNSFKYIRIHEWIIFIPISLVALQNPNVTFISTTDRLYGS